MNESEIVTVEPSEMRLGIIPARTPHDVIVQATAIAKELAGIVKTNHLSRNIQGREYVQVEGWSTMGAMLGVLPREIPEMFKTFEDGSCEATVELIRISDGAVIGRASAFVGMDEKDRNGKLTWGSRPLYARRSMSVTRATGKAYRLGFSWIMGLAGYAPTPAEEMEGVIEEQEHDAIQENKDNIRKVQANAEEVINRTQLRPYSPEMVKSKINEKAANHKNFIPSEKQQTLLRYGLSLCFNDDDTEDKRHTILKYLTGHASTKEVPGNLFKAIVEDWLKMKQKDDGSGEYEIDAMASKEAESIYTAAVFLEVQATLI
jgi:hypothetical protein